MLKKRRIFFLLWTLSMPPYLLQADLPDQLTQLAGGLEQLKNKLNELGAALHALKERLENKEDELAQKVEEAATDSSKLDDLFAVILPHLNDEAFTEKVEEAFKKLPYDSFTEVEGNFVENVSGASEESNKIKDLLFNVHESFAHDDIEKNDFDKATKKMQKLYDLEISYNQHSFKTKQEFFVKKLIQNSENLSLEQLRTVARLINENYKKEFFVEVIKKALTEKSTFSLELKKQLATGIITAITVDISIARLKEILDDTTLSLFYKHKAIELLKNGIKDIKKYGEKKDKPRLYYLGKELIADELRKKLIPDYTDSMFDSLEELLEKGLSHEQIAVIVSIVNDKKAYSFFYKNIYDAFIDEGVRIEELKAVLYARIIDDHPRKPLAERILMRFGYFNEENDWGEEATLPGWFEALEIPENIEKDLLLNIFKLFFSKDLKLFEKNYEKLKDIEIAIKDKLFEGELIDQLDEFCKEIKMASPRAKRLSSKIESRSADYLKQAEEEARKAKKAGGIASTLRDFLTSTLKKVRTSVTGDKAAADSDYDYWSDEASSEE